MKVLFVASEVNPIIKSGGLADVIGALPKELVHLGIDVRIAIPDYSTIINKQLKYIDQPKFFTINLPAEKVDCWVSQVLLPETEIPVYLFKTSRGLSSKVLYPAEGDGDQDRFILFNLAVIEWLKTSVWQPSLVHCHDWMTGAIPQLVQQHKLPYPTVFTIHNLFYQGLTNTSYFKEYGINTRQPGSKINLLRLGINTASFINTVSPTYANEALTLEYGGGLEQTLKKRRSDFKGILNGVDYEKYSPENNPHLIKSYSIKNVAEGKLVSKQALQHSLGLTSDSKMPLYGFVGRLTDQKGLGLIEAAIQQTPLLDYGQLVMLGVGDKYWERRLASLASTRGGAMSVNTRFDEKLAHQIYAASDFFLVPSRFEPCGLTQLIAMKFGSLPIARQTGGLADTVVNQRDNSRLGTGITFKEYSAKSFSQALGGSLGLYNNHRQMAQTIHSAMTQDYSWAKSANQYIQIYHDLIK